MPDAPAHANGAAPAAGPRTLRQVRAERRLVEAEIRLARVKQAQKLTEDLGWNGGADYSSFGGSDLFYRARTGGDWLPVPPSVPSDRRHGQQWPLIRTEPELDRARQQSRLLCGVNSFAQGLLRNRRNYTIGKGFSYKVSPKGVKSGEEPTEGVKRVVEMVRAVVDRFLERNRWNAAVGSRLSLIIASTREQEAYCRVARDGEMFIRFFFEDDGETTVRAAEPECVRQSADTPEAEGWSFGIKHQMEPYEDVETPEAYSLVWQDPATAGLHQDARTMNEIVEAKFILHLKGPQTDAALARGLPDFCYDVARALERAAQLQRNISVGDAARAATAELWKFTGYTQSQVSAWAGANTDAERSFTDPMTGQQVNVDTRRPGAVRAIPAGMDLAQLPVDNSTPAYMQGLAGDLRQAAAAFASPEYWLGDASNGNYSSLETATAPPVKNGESEQEYYRVAFAAVVWRAVRWAVECGKLPPDALTAVDIQVEAPAVLHRDKLQKSQADQIDIQCGKKSPQTAAMEDGLDPETELANLEEYKERSGDSGGALPMPGEDDGEGGVGGQDFGGGKPKPPPPKPGADGAVKGSRVQESATAILREAYGDRVAALVERAAVRLLEDFDASAHPRGQPGNAGQFGSGGGGGSSGDAGAAPAKKPAKASKARVELHPSVANDPAKKKKLDGLLKKAFPGRNPAEACASVVGAPDDASVKLRLSDDGRSVWVDVDHPAFAQTCKRRLSREGGKDGRLYVHNEIIDIKESQRGSGLGSDIFANQVANAQEMGVDWIECHAARLDNSGGKYFNGYYTWPRMGYDQYLEDIEVDTPDDRFVADNVGKLFPGAETVQDVMKTKEGRDWWKEHGVDLTDAKFDLKPGSRSLAVHEAYMAEREKAKPKAAPTAESLESRGGGGAARGGAEEIDLAKWEDAALERAWARLEAAGDDAD